ncbi:cupin domain-containing protein [Christiangramia salexigens]|uniref:Cupin n=1 Tax=Christiangramia salexigens TaxID=1913577 RepID=A0A1L3J372_9FLAO|nr:cupin domain-containing protein [Christiangramia salexigens]APG59574.1 cupin [Christiangramia salexigens]
MKSSNSDKWNGWFLISLIFILVCPSVIAQSEASANHSVAVDLNNTNLEWGGCPEFMPEGCNIAVLHGDPATNNADILFKVPAKSDIPEHWHNSAERMVLISGSMEVTYEGEKATVLNPGSYAYGPAKKPHKARCLDSGPCVLFIAFEGPVDAFAGNKH